MSDVDKATLTLRKELMCLNCWQRFLPEDVLWISEHRDFLGGDPILKNDAPMRFVPARFTLQGEAIDPRGQLCGDIACPNCRLHLPRALLEHEARVTGSAGGIPVQPQGQLAFDMRPIEPCASRAQRLPDNRESGSQ